MQLENSSAIVTGGASGLGAATAAALADRGVAVVVVDLPNGADAVAADPRLTFAAADVRDEAQVEAAVDTAAELGPIRVVVNCAGIGPSERILRRGVPGSLDFFQRVVEINLIGTFNVMRLAAEKMATNEPDPETGDRGIIVNTASVAAFEGQIGQAAYAASKGGIASLTLPAARDLASIAVRVMTIAPGILDTPMLQTVGEEIRGRLAASVPYPSRLGRPDEYAQLALHFVDNALLNGDVVRLDGAIRMAPR
ncbi:MAG: SDR family NAD(P)-dependent oxidoreductase [Solirubrobacteraceae bacterium]